MDRIETPMRFFLDNAWRRLAGLPELEINKEAKPLTLKDLASRFNEKFVEYMRNRIAFGRLRYGSRASEYRHLEGAKRCLTKYQETKNKEYLVDAANYCLLEFGHPSIEGTFFEAVDDGEFSQIKK